MSSPSSSSSSRVSSPDSSRSNTVSNRLVRIKNEPISHDEEPEPLTIERPGQDGVTSDYVIGTVEAFADYLRNLPPSKDKQRIIDLENENLDLKQQVAMKGIVTRSMKESYMRKQIKLEENASAQRQELEKEIVENDENMREYSEDLRRDVREWERKFNSEAMKCSVLETEAELARNQLREMRQEKFAVEDENKRLKKQLEVAQKDKDEAVKQVSIATAKARAKEAKVAELEGRVGRRNCSLAYAVNDVERFKKILKESNTAEAFKKLDEMCKKVQEQAVKPVVCESVRSTPKPPTNSITKQTVVPSGSQSFAKPVVESVRSTPKPPTTSTAKRTSVPPGSKSFAESMVAPTPCEILPTVRVSIAPNREYIGFDSDDVRMRNKTPQPMQTINEQDWENQFDTSSTRPNASRRRHSSTSSTTKPSSSRFHPYG